MNERVKNTLKLDRPYSKGGLNKHQMKMLVGYDGPITRADLLNKLRLQQELPKRVHNTLQYNHTYSNGGLNVDQIRKLLDTSEDGMSRTDLITQLKLQSNNILRPRDTIEIYHQDTLPDNLRKEILSSGCWNNMCQGLVPWGGGSYPRNAVKSAKYIIVATVDPYLRSQYVQNSYTDSRHMLVDDSCDSVVGFMLVLDSDFISPLTGTNVCKKNELYLDVVCALPGYGSGRRLINRLFKHASSMNKRQIRLYSVPGALNMWKKYGFKECENAQKETGCYRKVYKEDPDQGFRMTCDVRQYLETSTPMLPTTR